MPISPDSAELTAFACRLADAARAETLGRWRDAGASRNKAHGALYDPVTQADVSAEAAMRKLIREVYPAHGIAGEEFADQPASNNLTWSLDPIDGTRSFVCGLPTWVTLIGLLRNGEPVLGVIDAPRLGERYIGDGVAATLLPEARRLSASTCRALGEARLSTTDPDLFADDQAAGFARVRRQCRIVRYGHDGYAYARLADGSLDLIVEAGLKPYDLMALVPVVRGAGGVIGNWRGGGDLSGGDVVAASTPELFDRAVAALSA